MNQTPGKTLNPAADGKMFFLSDLQSNQCVYINYSSNDGSVQCYGQDRQNQDRVKTNPR